MSSTNKWIVAIVIIAIIVFGLWLGGYLGGGTPVANQAEQSAAVQTGATAPIDSSDATIGNEAAAIDAQMKVVGNQFATFSQAPTTAKADMLAGQLGGLSNMMNTLSKRFQARVTTLKNLGVNTNTLQSAVSDMNLQISTAVSQIGAAAQAFAKIAPDKGSQSQINQNVASMKQVVIELQKSKTYLEAAQVDIKTVIATLKITTVQ